MQASKHGQRLVGLDVVAHMYTKWEQSLVLATCLDGNNIVIPARGASPSEQSELQVVSPTFWQSFSNF